MNPEELPLRDLHLPPLTSWWPLAPGWWVLITLFAALLLWLAWRGFRHWRRNAARRYALRQLDDIRHRFDDGADPVELGKSLSELTRRAMLAYAARDEVAGLTGDAWLFWLDQQLDSKPFTGGAGRLLESLPYVNPQSIDLDTDIRGLLDAVELRLRTPLQTELVGGKA